jgi:hypothetical protein
MLGLLRAVVLVTMGAIAGFAGAAVALRGWLAWRGQPTPSEDELDVTAIFDGVELENRSSAFRGGRVLAWFAGVTLDLRGATLAPGARLELRSLFAGMRVAVPAGCRVEHETRSIIGGAAVSVPEPVDPDAPVLVVRALSVVGGISVEG